MLGRFSHLEGYCCKSFKNVSNNEIKTVLCNTSVRYYLEYYAFQNRTGLLEYAVGNLMHKE